MENGYNADSAASSSCYSYPYVNCCSSYDTYGNYSFTGFYGTTYDSSKYYQQIPDTSNQYYHNQTQLHYPHCRALIASTSDYANLFLNSTIPNNCSSTSATTTATTINCSSNGYGRGNRIGFQRPKYAWMLEREKDHQQTRHFQQIVGSTTDTLITSQTGKYSSDFELLSFFLIYDNIDQL